jgi:hypothetical protein
MVSKVHTEQLSLQEVESALKQQCFPDTPNRPYFPSATLLPGEEYYQMTIYKFTIEK